MRRVLFLLVLVFFGLACSRREGPNLCEKPDAAALDQPIVAFLSAARAAHHEADIREQANDSKAALDAMKRLTQIPTPHSDKRIPEVDEVLADTWARIAELSMKNKDLEGAESAVTQGMKLAGNEPNYFYGHLLELQGVVEEQKSYAYQDAGKFEPAIASKERAIELLQKAMRVQEQVIARAADGGTK